MIKIDRRQFGIGAAGLAGTAVLPNGALAQANPALAALKTGKPHAGQEVKVLCVVATQFTAHEKRLAAFTDHTGITVKYTYIPFTNMREALAAEMVGGTGDFDVVVVMDQWIPSLNNLMDPMDARIAEKKIDLARYPKAFVQLGNVGGRQLGLPTRAHVQLLFYRKDLFAKHNIAAPGTWDDVIAAGKTIQEKETGISGIAIPYGKNNGQNLMIWYNFLWARGADVFDNRGQPAFASEAGLKATQEYVDILRVHKVAPAAAVSFSEQDAVTSMRSGNSAMLPIWWWARGSLLDQRVSKLTEDQLAFVPLPTFPGGQRSTYINCWIYALTRNAKRKDAAMEFITYVTDPSIERDILVDPKENDVVATQWASLRDPEVNRRFAGMHAFAAEALQNTKVVPYSPEWPQIMEAIETAMSEAASGTKPVPEAFRQADATVRRIVRRG
jgi:multiple sugar transport system substrate-binding protein